MTCDSFPEIAWFFGGKPVNREPRMRCGSLIAGLVLAASNSIGSPLSVSTRIDDSPLISVSVAHTGIRHASEFATEGRIEYRSNQQLWVFKPFVGAMANSNGTLYGFAGVLIDFILWNCVVITPSFAPGLYHAGRGKDLGFPLEFRSQIELSYRFPRGYRVGVGFNHISNAMLGNINPGIEAVSITFSTPGIPGPGG
jgi:lipid A 3-O-deacylase